MSQNKLGLHLVQGPRNGYGRFLERCAKAGRPVAVVKSIDDPSPLVEAQGYSDLTVTVYRARNAGDLPEGNFSGDPRAVAEAWMAHVIPYWPKGFSFYEPTNEPDPEGGMGYLWLNDFMIRCLGIAEAKGYKLAVYGFATGVPEIDEFECLLPSLRRARDGGHALSLHEYGLGGTLRESEVHWLALRYRKFYTQVLEPEGLSDLPLLITEAAPNGGHDWNREGAETFLDDVFWYAGELERDPYVLGAAIYTLGTWANANFQDVLPQIADWIIHHPTPDVPPVEPTTEPAYWLGLENASVRDHLAQALQAAGVPVRTQDKPLGG